MQRLIPTRGTSGRLAAAFVLVALTLLTAACPAGTVHKAREAVADVASGLQAVQAVNEQLYEAKLITPAEGAALAGFVVEATYLTDNAHACVANLSNNATAIAGCVQPYVDQLKTQEAMTLLKIGNPEARSKFETALRGVDAALAVLQSILGSLHPAQPGANPTGA